jgi:hypothetical protein
VPEFGKSSDPRTVSIINFVLANIGQGPARNVSFIFEGDQQDFADHKVHLLNDKNRTATSVLPQGERLVAFFGMGHELVREPRLKPFTVRIDYEDLARRRREARCTLDVSQFAGLVRLGSPAEHEAAEALKKLALEIQKWSNQSTRLKVETITTEEQEKRDQKWTENVYEKQDDS